MDCCPCRCLQTDEKRIENQIHDSIENELKKSKENNRAELKILLLGTAEAGKSTVLKQMQIIHGKEFADEEKRKEYAESIRENVMESIIIILNAMKDLGIDFENEENRKIADEVRKSCSKGYNPNTVKALFKIISLLWKDDGVQEAYNNRGDFKYVYLNESAKYFFDRVDEIARTDYVPSVEGILRVRKSSTGVQEYSFKVRNVWFRVVDVGGQRTERRKWIHCFENVTSVIFITSLSEYDQLLLERDLQTGKKHNVNRLKESLALFSVIIHERFLQEAAIILFLNKTDIFNEKIKRRPMEKYFPEYRDFTPSEPNPKPNRRRQSEPEEPSAEDRLVAAGKEFILQKFLSYVKAYLLKTAEREREIAGPKLRRRYEVDPDKLMYSHYTCATDTNGMKFVTSAVEDYNLRISLMNFHLQ